MCVEQQAISPRGEFFSIRLHAHSTCLKTGPIHGGTRTHTQTHTRTRRYTDQNADTLTLDSVSSHLRLLKGAPVPLTLLGLKTDFHQGAALPGKLAICSQP